MSSRDRHVVYKSLETDEEFVARLPYRPYTGGQKLEGEFLDACAWQVFHMQRKIVERTT